MGKEQLELVLFFWLGYLDKFKYYCDTKAVVSRRARKVGYLIFGKLWASKWICTLCFLCMTFRTVECINGKY